MIKTAHFLMFQALRNNVSIRGIMGYRHLVKLLNQMLKDGRTTVVIAVPIWLNRARQFWAEAIQG
ncbi:MAG: hypothetical protein CTY16_19500 [Methylobacter sp.]|nr:MAG: hypothetical protein CTY16_19500 [Methylobacter sp.]